MNGEILNGSLEVGLRALAILSSAFPKAYDVSSLAFFDYTLLHSSEFGGPESINPDVPNHRSEIAIKQEILEHGLEVMIRAKLVMLCVGADGIGYAATDDAPGFVALLESGYMHGLRDRADWVIRSFGDIESEVLRAEITNLTRWADNQEPHNPDHPLNGEEPLWQL